MTKLQPIRVHPSFHTPAGAAVYVTRDRRSILTSIRVDRLPIADATPAQCAAVRDLAISEWVMHVAPMLEEARETSYCADPTFWQFWILSTRERAVIQELHRIEREVR
ncbi:hypothetical protein DY023_06595 [Microbacterium bovistercoris]|uniref:Uncharacterized protein n=1 Tax=Microbacterium bovistercoris TaxID=2293570 RepID=A0A371NV97_9MICO|nr:hypothetical protein [Microbacterium bovistercoris]REJ06294.1 hypothetical protein DY023_06595 [Microbacterium bovistercoris]